MVWHWLGWVVVLVTVLLGVGLTVLQFPGIWLIVAVTGLYALATGGDHVGWAGVLTLAGVGLVAEGVEFFAGGAGAKKAGASAWATTASIIGSIIGGILGSIFIPIPVAGTILGLMAGAFVFGAVAQYARDRDAMRALAVGWGAALGRLVGTVAKSVFAVVIAMLAIWMALPLRGAGNAPAAPGAATPVQPAPDPAILPTTGAVPATMPALLPAGLLPTTAPTTTPVR